MIATRDGEVVAVHRATQHRQEPAALRRSTRSSSSGSRTRSRTRASTSASIYHSHTRSDPVPSQTDINLAQTGDGTPQFPGTLYLIVGVKGPEPDLRLWSIVGNDVRAGRAQGD